RMVSTIWISLRRPLTKDGRSGRSMSREARIAVSDGRAPPRQKERGTPLTGRTALPTEKRAGNPAHCVHPLFHVDGEGEEIQVFLRLLGRRGRRKHHGLAIQGHQGRAGSLTGQAARLEPDCVYAKLAVVNNGFGTVDTLHG